MRLGISELTHYIVVWFQDTSTPPVGKAGLTPTCRIKRHADGQFWTGAAWQAGVSSLALAEWDAANLPGVYRIAKPTVTVVTEITVWVDAGTSASISQRYGIASFLIDPKVDLGTNLDAEVSTRAPEAAGNVAAIKAKTDNLPADPASEATLTALSAVAARALGLSFENSGEREVIWDADHRLSSSKTYLYDSAGHAETNDGITGVVAGYQMTISYGIGGFRDGWKVVRIA